MRLLFLFGFLGSGKTTLARRILEEWGPRERLALIVNEFGDVGVDGTILSGRGIDVVELTSGCLCCTLKGPMLQAIDELAARRELDHVVIEATGIAEPSELIGLLADPAHFQRLSAGPLVTVVDGAKFEHIRQLLGPFYNRQIESADMLVVNKIDLTDALTLTGVEAKLREMNPTATLHFAEHADIDIAELMKGAGSGVVARRLRAINELRSANHVDGPADHHSHHDHGHPQHASADSFVVPLPGTVDRTGLERFFAAAPPGLWRSKGYLDVDGAPALVQYALSGLDITPAEVDRPGGFLVFIGSDLDRAALTSALSTLSV